ncbi:MAG: glycosyl transferase, WecB/TagA/CpsF family, partial [Paenibacillus sp.]|nr:glycosyl transferase, WecB/TagA/CpsF family [Paenibacillus sp.]
MSKQPPTVPIFGIPFSKMTMDETVRYLTTAIEEGRQTHVITANP